MFLFQSLEQYNNPPPSQTTKAYTCEQNTQNMIFCNFFLKETVCFTLEKRGLSADTVDVICGVDGGQVSLKFAFLTPKKETETTEGCFHYSSFIYITTIHLIK